MPVVVTVSGVHLVSKADCGDNQICYSVTVDCNGLVPREAQIRVNHSNGSKGAVVFTSGGFGTGFYADQSGSPMDTVNRMRNAGYETYEVGWAGERGWQTDSSGQGYKKVMCAYAELVRWITTDLADNPDAMGATGQSAGSVHIGYGLTLYGLEEIFDVVVLTGGPAAADLVGHCARSGESGGPDYIMGWLGNGEYCKRGEVVPESAIVALQAESIVSAQPGELRDYHYPNTMVAFVEGELHVPNVLDGELYRDAITSETTWVVVPGVGHGVHRDPVGAATIQAVLTGSPTPTPTPTPDEGPTPVSATIPVGGDPQGVGVNLSTNRIYVANLGDDTVSVIDGVSNAVIATIPVGDKPFAIGVNSTNGRVYVTNRDDDTVSVIDGASNTVIATVPVGDQPFKVGVNPATDRAYVGNWFDGTVSVIDGASNAVIATIPVGDQPFAIQAIGVNSVTNRVYVTNFKDGTLSVIDGASNTVIATIPVGKGPFGVGVNPNTNRVYMTHFEDDTVSVIDGASNAVIATIPVGDGPVVVGVNLTTDRVYVANHTDGTVSVIDGATDAVIATFPVGNAGSNVWLGVNPSTDRLYVSNGENDTVYVIDETLVTPTP